MRNITKKQLAEILDRHGKWLRNEEGGERADLRYADLRYADLSDADLRYANLRYADLSYADLRYADLRYADLSDADLRYANLNSANLRYADLRYADLSDADLSYADLSYADLNSANLNSANLRYADLRYANLRYADLSYAKLGYASLSSAVLWGSTGNMGEIKSIALDTYPITYTAEYLQIGCERHRISEWWEFSDERISRMDSGALVWWQKWKGFIQQAIELSPATPTTLAQMISSQDKD